VLEVVDEEVGRAHQSQKHVAGDADMNQSRLSQQFGGLSLAPTLN
jgi:hypothetical protein